MYALARHLDSSNTHSHYLVRTAETLIITSSRDVYLVERPKGQLTPSAFEVRSTTLAAPAENEALVRTLYISIDAANRFWMHGDSAYHSGAAAGEIMAGRVLGSVEACPSGAFAEGDLVVGDWGWRERANVPINAIQRAPTLDESMPLSHILSVFGTSGLAGWFGITEIARPQPGDVVVVTATAGATGAFAAQVAQAAGARVIGITGGETKRSWVQNEYGFETIDRHARPLGESLDATLPPEGIDVYFDNVGGEPLETMLPRMRLGGKVICCGALSAYDSDDAMTGAKGVPALVVTRRLSMIGFIVLDYARRFPEARAKLTRLIKNGQLKVHEDIMEGIESAPKALIDILALGNFGKRLVRVDPDAR